MNHKKIILNVLTSGMIISAVVFSFHAAGQSISGVTASSDNATEIIKSETATEQNNVVSPSIMTRTMTENTQQANEPVSKWFKEKSWFKNIKLVPSATINLEELKKYYAANPTYWEKAFEFISKTDLLNLSVGKHLVDGENVFANVAEYDTQEPAERKWENHKKYIDIQIVLSGKEMIGIAPYAEATPDQPYNETGDIEFRKVSNGKDYFAQPGTFFIFFPSDSHRPNQKAGEIVKVKKVVFKIATH